MVVSELYTHLRDNCPTLEGRIYPVKLDKDFSTPCLTYKIIGDYDVETLGCVVGSKVRFQLDVFDTGYLDCINVKNEVKVALKSFAHTPKEMYVHEAYEDQLELHRQIIDFLIKF